MNTIYKYIKIDARRCFRMLSGNKMSLKVHLDYYLAYVIVTLKCNISSS